MKITSSTLKALKLIGGDERKKNPLELHDTFNIKLVSVCMFLPAVFECWQLYFPDLIWFSPLRLPENCVGAVDILNSGVGRPFKVS